MVLLFRHTSWCILRKYSMGVKPTSIAYFSLIGTKCTINLLKGGRRGLLFLAVPYTVRT